MRAPARTHRQGLGAFYAAPGIAVAVILVLGLGPPALLVPRATVCQLGARLGTYAIWTPETPVNKPLGVNVSAQVTTGGWNFTFTSGSLTVGALNPSGPYSSGWGYYGPSSGISMLGSLNNWSFYNVTNKSVVGGASDPCTQPYVAELGLPPVANCSNFVTIPIQNDTNDSIEPHVWNGLWGPDDTYSEPPSCSGAMPGAYVWFDSSFHANGTGASAPVRWDLCSETGSTMLYVPGVAEVPVTVYAPYAGHEISASGFEAWTGSAPSIVDTPVILGAATYEVPDGWIWLLAPVGPTSTPLNPDAALPSLVAFERLAC